ncbi:MAG: hydrogenase [Burkholderiaceae bacterium]|nr:hydrogenase [Burkholderiaceae bacterium]
MSLADAHPLLQRLVQQFDAAWITPDTLADWADGPGDRVLLLAGDPVRFPEGLDVAVVLPELQRAHGGRFTLAVADPAHEDALARRWGSNRWPALVFLRDGGYVGVLAGMHDWTDYVERVGELLAAPVVRAPTVGIPVVAAASGSCH